MAQVDFSTLSVDLDFADLRLGFANRIDAGPTFFDYGTAGGDFGFLDGTDLDIDRPFFPPQGGTVTRLRFGLADGRGDLLDANDQIGTPDIDVRQANVPAEFLLSDGFDDRTDNEALWRVLLAGDDVFTLTGARVIDNLEGDPPGIDGGLANLQGGDDLFGGRVREGSRVVGDIMQASKSPKGGDDV
ncbi:MAG: hypothetical protein AAF192_23270, partial [Pseudomonadota bacterium]